jgi:hypothetical protein
MQHVSAIKWKMIRLVGHRACSGEIRNAYAILIKKSQTKKLREMPKVYVRR